MQTSSRTPARSEFKFKLVKHIAPLSTRNDKGYRLELNLVSFNDAEPKYDVRMWDPDHQKMSKGVSFTFEELDELAEAIKKLRKS